MSYRMFYLRMILPLAELYSHTSILRKLEFLRISQHWSKTEIEDYQMQKLQELLTHAYENVPYYKKLFDKHRINPRRIRSRKDLRRIPVLTKDLINKHYKELQDPHYQGRTFVKFTSGSTGVPTNFVRTPEDYSWEWAAHYRAWEWTGYRFGDRFVKISLNDDRYLLKKRLQDMVLRCLYLYVYKVGEDNLGEYVRKIRQFRPKIIYGYTSSIKVLAEYMREHGIKYKAQAVITMGSKLTTAFRKLMEERFECKVFDGYGCGGEGLNIAAQCEQGKYHINDELQILEVERGEAIVTGLHNYAMPLIRYKPEDHLRLGGRCGCGRQLGIIKSISGRTQEVIKTPSGKTLVVEFVISAFEFIEGITQYKVIQQKIDGITIQLRVNEKYDKARDEKKICDFFLKAAGPGFSIAFEYPRKITDKNGKTRIIESELK